MTNLTSPSASAASCARRAASPTARSVGHALNTWLRQNDEVDGACYGWGPYLWAPDCGSREVFQGKPPHLNRQPTGPGLVFGQAHRANRCRGRHGRA